MLAIYDRAVESGRKVSDETVAAAARELITVPVHELGEGSQETPEDDDEDEDELTEDQQHLLDRLNEYRDSLADMIFDGKTTKVRKLLEQMQEVVS